MFQAAVGSREGAFFGRSPNGKVFGVIIARGLDLVNVETGEIARVAEGPITAFAWSPDGSCLAFDLREKQHDEIWMIEMKDLQRLWVADPASARERASAPAGRAVPPKPPRVESRNPPPVPNQSPPRLPGSGQLPADPPELMTPIPKYERPEFETRRAGG